MNKLLTLLFCVLILSCSKSGHKRDVKNENLSERTIDYSKNDISINHHSIKVIEKIKPLNAKIVLPFRDEAGVKIVRIKVNDVPLDFIFDTGASLISISETEANFLVKQGTLTKDDFLGIQQFIDANGDISEGLLVNLKEIDIQGYKLKNIKASIVQNTDAPLLLGQSLIEKFAQVTIDNKENKIILK